MRPNHIGLLAAALMFAAMPLSAALARYGIEEPATPQEIAPWNIDILPDGTGLPAGHGSVQEGAHMFAQECAACHGAKGTAGNALIPRLVGGPALLRLPVPVRTVGNYWPYATTLFDYIRRAMPLTAPQSLTPDEVYAVSAYVLFLNGIVSRGTVLDTQNLPKIRMPNRDGFVRAGQASGNANVPR